MFANATLLSILADIRRADDLRPRRVSPVDRGASRLSARLARAFRRQDQPAARPYRDSRDPLHVPTSS